MRNRRIFTAFCLSLLMLSGCSKPSTSSPVQSADEANVIKSAVTYLSNMDWLPTDENVNQATIQSITVDGRYELIDTRFKGKRAWLVTFPTDPQRTVEIPQVLVELESNEVIGYLPSE